MADIAISCSHLGFYYRPGKLVLDGVSFSVSPGETMGLIGPNGAGKTTLIKLLVGLLRPRAGAVRIYDDDPFARPEVRRHIGIVHQNGGFEEFLSGWDNLVIVGRFFGLRSRQVRRRVEYLSDQLGLDASYLDQPVITLSGGQRKRLQILRALLHRPSILYLDEPTVGLDVVGRKSLYEAIRRLKRDEGITIVWSSHYLTELETNSDNVLLLLGPSRWLHVPTKNLAKLSARTEVHIDIAWSNDCTKALVEKYGLKQESDNRIVYIGNQKRLYNELLPALNQCGVELVSVTQLGSWLEDVYIELLGKEGQSC